MNAWTLGTPEWYEAAVRKPGNGKAPGGYIFRTRRDALAYLRDHPKLPYAPYKMRLPAPYHRVASRDVTAIGGARHAWHLDRGADMMGACWECTGMPPELDTELTLMVCPFIDPDTGAPAIERKA